jgi:hypothetical protein
MRTPAETYDQIVQDLLCDAYTDEATCREVLEDALQGDFVNRFMKLIELTPSKHEMTDQAKDACQLMLLSFHNSALSYAQRNAE